MAEGDRRVRFLQGQIQYESGRIPNPDRIYFDLKDTRLSSVLKGKAFDVDDEGWIAEEQVVGATGETVQPDLYVAVGIRGDTYHAFGIRDAKFVVAIHPEKDAPILKSADAGLVGDPAKIVPSLIQALQQ